jgi:hypothetical protein
MGKFQHLHWAAHAVSLPRAVNGCLLPGEGPTSALDPKPPSARGSYPES